MDRISNLSDDLLLKIVSSLPTKNVAATMLLSKRWRFLWTMLPKLHFNDDYDYGSDSEIQRSEYEKFVKYVDRSLVLNRAPVLETLKFGVGLCSSTEDVATWIRIGMVRHVPELDIGHCEDYFERHRSIKLPKTLYTYEKLEVLKLTWTIILDVPTDVCLPSLKTLHLVSVAYKNKQSHRRLLSGCPVLEELVVDKTKNSYSLRSYYVEMPALQRLSLLDTCDSPNDGDDGIHKVVISVPSLKYLNLVDFFGDLCLCENMPEVVEANVRVVYRDPKKLLESIPSVKRLHLCLSASMLEHRIGFYHLVHLELCVYAIGWDILTWMLESSPKLQVLNICKCKEYLCAMHADEGPWRGPSSVPECLMFHLHTFKWKNCELKDEEKQIVAYMLKSARQLKTACISACRRYSKKEEQSQKLSELVSLPRASSSCQLMLWIEKSW